MKPSTSLMIGIAPSLILRASSSAMPVLALPCRMAAYMGVLLHRRGCPRSLPRRSFITHIINGRGEQQGSPRAQYYAIRRNSAIGGDADAQALASMRTG